MPRLQRAAATALTSPSAETFGDLAAACIEHAASPGSPVVPALALHSFFRGLAGYLGARPVAAGAVAALAGQLRPLLVVLIEQGLTGETAAAVGAYLGQNRSIIRGG